MAISTRKGTTYSEPSKNAGSKKPTYSESKKPSSKSSSGTKVGLSVTSGIKNIRKSAAKARDI